MTGDHPKTVLVIEDEPAGRRSIAAYLEDSGFSVMEAGDGQAGLDLFAQKKPDIVVTDLRMPVLDGFGVMERLREISPETPIIVITGATDISLMDTASGFGARECVPKPINDMRSLEEAILRALTRGSGLDDVHES